MTIQFHPLNASAPLLDQLATIACAGIHKTNAPQLLEAANIPTSEWSRPTTYSTTPTPPQRTQNTQLMMAARLLTESIPEYDSVASRLLLRNLTTEVSTSLATSQQITSAIGCHDSGPRRDYQQGFEHYIKKGVELGLINPDIATCDLSMLASKITPNHDSNLTYMELQSLSSQFLMRHKGKCFELPQYAFMRIAIALAKKENHDEKRIIEIYRLLSVRSYARITAKTFGEGTTKKSASKKPTTRPHLRLVH